MCLHGFPDTANTWRHLFPELAEAGYRTVAPWLRGYAPTALPADSRYQSRAIAVDAIELHEALGGGGDAVGHDWGARAATGAAALAGPVAIVTMAVPPAGAVAEEFLTFRQLKRSGTCSSSSTCSPTWPCRSTTSPSSIVSGRTGRRATPTRPTTGAGSRRPSPAPRTCPPRWATTERPCNPSCRPRARRGGGSRGLDAAREPHLYLHGVDDGCMGVELAERAAAYLTVEGSRVELVPGTSHFLYLEAPDTVNRLVLDFLTD